MGLNRRVGQLAYGLLFSVLLPAGLALWARMLDHSAMTFWPVPFGPATGIALAVFGAGLLLASMAALGVVGKGLPMNAFPPPRFVAGWTYAVLSHPIYVGFVLVCAGVSIAAGSPSGLWVVTPVVALGAAALVAGYEGPKLRERFGQARVHAPLLGLPLASARSASPAERVGAAVCALGPWAIAYGTLSLMPAPQGAVELRIPWEWGIAPQGWAFWVYSAAYPVVVASPLLLRTGAQLRRLVAGAWIATACGLGSMLLFPGTAQYVSPSPGEVPAWLLWADRALDAPWLALPSFHAVWAVFALQCLRIRFPRWIAAWVALTAAICASCVLTGSHAIVDVVAGACLGWLAWNHDVVWDWCVRRAESLANSWGALRIGPVRIISHAVWPAVAAFSGILVALSLTGPGQVGRVAVVFGAGLLAAGAWGYLLEGGGRLSRPFGYFGYLLGAIAAIGAYCIADPASGQVLAAAFAVGAPLTQALGRLRCLVQGCCHGRPVLAARGIRVLHPCSRVTALAALRGVAIHPTQLYSMVANIAIFLVLWRMWQVRASAGFACGMYLVLSSLARFAEEQYRGEPQTRRVYGLAIYQWLCIAMLLAGIFVCSPAGVALPAPRSPGAAGVVLAVVAGVLAALFMSVDFPDSTRRFSRLTVNTET
jgi:protein-S-isoprenylcysteine O-methyltransferase Ste14